jgi:hypothetical protein
MQFSFIRLLVVQTVVDQSKKSLSVEAAAGLHGSKINSA